MIDEFGLIMYNRMISKINESENLDYHSRFNRLVKIKFQILAT